MDPASLVRATDNVESAIIGALAQNRGREWEYCFHERQSNQTGSVKSDSVFYLSNSAKNDLRKKGNVGYVYLLPSKNFVNGPELWATSKTLVRPVAKIAVTSDDVDHLLSRIKPRNQGMLHDAVECEGLKFGGGILPHTSKLPRIPPTSPEPALRQGISSHSGAESLSLSIGSV